MSASVWVVASAGTADRWAAAFTAAGFEGLPLAWGSVERVPGERFLAPVLQAGPPDALLLTSANAVRFRPENTPLDVPAACVGRATARAAEEAGFQVRWIGTGTGVDLARSLTEVAYVRRIVFLRAAEVAPEGVQWLRAHGRDVQEIVTYEARPRLAFGEDVRGAAEPQALALGSPRAVAALARALDLSARGGLRERPAAAIGSPTAVALRAHDFERVAQADPPGLEALIEAVHRLLGGHPSP